MTRRKYGNTPTAGHASKREAKRAVELRLLERAGVISDLREQVKYILIPRQDGPDGKCLERAVTWTADFVYRHRASLVTIAEDAKGVRTQQYVLRRKLMLWVHGIRIYET